MAILHDHDFNGDPDVDSLGFGTYSNDENNPTVEQASSGTPIVAGVGVGGTDAVESTNAVAIFVDVMADKGHDFHARVTVKNDQFADMLPAIWFANHLSIQGFVLENFGGISGYITELVSVGTASPDLSSDPADRKLKIFVATPATVANAEIAGFPEGAEAPDSERHLVWYLPDIIDPAAFHEIEIHGRTSTRLGNQIQSDGYLCVTVDSVLVWSAQYVPIGSAWGLTLGGEETNPENTWNTISVQPQGVVDDLFLEDVSVACESCPTASGVQVSNIQIDGATATASVGTGCEVQVSFVYGTDNPPTQQESPFVNRGTGPPQRYTWRAILDLEPDTTYFIRAKVVPIDCGDCTDDHFGPIGSFTTAAQEIDPYSDQDMQCPAEYYGGFKEARLMRCGDATRALSHPWTGEWTGSTFSFTISDFDQKFRRQLASPTDRYWVLPLAVRMTTRANRAALGIPFTAFVGPIIEAQPIRPLALDVTLGDIVSHVLLSDKHQVPWRIVRDGFLDQLDVISDALDLDTPEPIIYGRHTRIPSTDVTTASGQGFEINPIYLGRETLASGQYHCWLVAGHACADIPEVRVWTPTASAGSPAGTSAESTPVSVLADPDWLIPFTAAWTTAYGVNYVDRLSETYGDQRRYTLVYGLVGSTFPETAETDADAVVLGEKTLTVAVEGVEPSGDGVDPVILDRFTQYKHFLINYVANHGRQSYQSGSWLSSPSWNIVGATVPIVDEDSFDTCSAIALERFPGEGSPGDGYQGAAVIGAQAGTRASVLHWIAAWNRSCGCLFGISRAGQIRVVLLHPTDAIKAAAPLYTDVNDIIDGSFGTSLLWGQHATEIPFRGDYDHRTGRYLTSDVATEGLSSELYARDIPSEVREYPFAPGITALNHMAILELRQRQHPPRLVILQATVGPDADGDSLAYRELGDYIRYRAYPAIGTESQTRLAWVIKSTVKVGDRRVLIEALDCEDLIDFDAPDV